MDASESTEEAGKGFSKVCGFYLKIENATLPMTLKQNNTVMKYTKLPDFDFDSKVSWPQNSYILPPRLRRIVSLDDQVMPPRGMPKKNCVPKKIESTSFNSRKIVTISEVDENDLKPKFTRELKKITTVSKATEADSIQKAHLRQIPSKYLQYNKTSMSANSDKLRESSFPSKSNLKCKTSNSGNQNLHNNINMKSRNVKEKETVRRNFSKNPSTKINVNRNKSLQCERNLELTIVKNDSVKALKNETRANNNIRQSENKQRAKSTAVSNDMKNRNNTSRMHVASEKDTTPNINNMHPNQLLTQPTYTQINKIDCSTEVEYFNNCRNSYVLTDPPPIKVDRTTEMEKNYSEQVYKSERKKISKFDEEVDMSNEFDSLEIPNVTLVKDKSDNHRTDLVCFHSQSLPNLQVPLLKFNSQSCENVKDQKCSSKVLHSNTSYIIGSATLTYTTSQKINFHLVGNEEHNAADLSSSPLAYPMNVVSVYKKEMEKKKSNEVTSVENTRKENNKSNANSVNISKEIKSIIPPYAFGNKKLVKPSDLISTISVNNDLLKSDYICEQFQRELNFIDSFFESLQYLENCSLSNNSLTNNKVENWVANSGFDLKSPEYDSFFSKLENAEDNEDSETMASKSLCLLNLLIRDEQRRAKNLLFVLKMREDALKDFTKSQILWLENKKKQDNTDISTLKKKQRGALLKLQHECGEMQRMRKALLALSEKRKVALMKTKKNIELKLKNNVTVDQIVLGKKKLKRNPASDRAIAPLKCFDLSSSGCDDIVPIRVRSDTILVAPEVSVITKSAEKSIQAGDSVLESVAVDKSTETAGENLIIVDGGYLNILFHNFSLPQIFSSGKQYEVNEDALKNIVSSSNANKSLEERNVVEKLVDQIQSRDVDKSTNSTPSTARSLVEELDQYYKGLTEEEKSPIDVMDRDYKDLEYDFDRVLLGDNKLRHCENGNLNNTSRMPVDKTEPAINEPTTADVDCSCATSPSISVSTQSTKVQETVSMTTQTSPFTASVILAPIVSSPPDTATVAPKSALSTSAVDSNINGQNLNTSITTLCTIPSPVQYEAEELRRQQLAVEREIKALEQQQLLVVREIPDKPPPPYTPPTVESRAHPLSRRFIVDDTIEQKIHDHLTGCFTSSEPLPQVDLFIAEYCNELVEKQKSDQSDKPWDACNLLPQKQQANLSKLIKKATTDLKEILSGAQPVVVMGVGARRSDHIDDILFAEWRRSEPEWTTLHPDEAFVKNQIFESIFEKLLTDTIDEYKKVAPLQISDAE